MSSQITNNNKVIEDLNNQKNINNYHNKKISNKNIKANKVNIGNIKQEKYVTNNQKNKYLKNNFKHDIHNTSGNNNKLFNNTFYRTKNENNNKNFLIKDNHRDNHNKVVVDIKESLKRGRNTSAPPLKQKDINKNNKNNYLMYNNKKFNYNKIKHNDDNSFNKSNIQRKKEENDISYDKIKDKNKLNKDRPHIPSKVDSINTRINRINNIKKNFISKTNKKLYNNIHNDKEADENNITERKYRDILENQEKIAILEKKLKENKIKLKNNDFYNYTSNNTKLNNTFNYNHKNPHENDNSFDNEEKMINTNTEDNKDHSLNHFHNNNYMDITPDKVKKNTKNNNSYMNNFDSIDATNNKDNSKIYNMKNQNKTGYSYTKKSDFIKKINIPKISKDKDKDLFNNNYNLYNKNIINTERIQANKKKSKKINIINLKTNENDYYYTKSSNIFNTVNNKLNKSSILPNNKNKINNTNKLKKNKNKIKLYPNYDIKKNNSVKKARIKTDFYNNNNNNNNKKINQIIGKRNSDKSQLQNKKIYNKNINNTYEKINSSKLKKYEAKVKKPKSKEKLEKLDDTEEIKHEEEKINENGNNGNNDINENNDNNVKLEKFEKNIRIIDKIGYICHAGEISFGKPKTNQDNYFKYNINSNLDDLIFVGVCDGHGENGHHVSDYLINHLPLDLEVEYLNNSENNSFENISQEKITKIFEESFLKTDTDLNLLCDNMKKLKLMGENVPNYFNCDYSGSTCISILLKKNDISTVYVANVGDSRAIIVKENNNNIWTFEQLSRDHKPTEEDEYKRIIEADGEIEAIEDDNGNWTGPLRVWEKGSEGPGLAMTRSLGDKVGTKIGVICTPEVSKYLIKDEDRAFIIASDGLWEYMPNQDVTEAVKELILDMRENNEISADIIANELFKQAVIRWRQKEPGMDDITIICVLLK